MSPEMGRGFFRIALFITLVAAVLLPFLPSGSPEFVVDVLALVVGLIFVVTIAVLARRSAGG